MNRWFLIAGILFLITSTSFALTGSGTEAAPYLIQSLADFNEFAGDPNYWDDYTRLETDIDLVGIPYTTAVIAPDTNSFDDYFQGTSFAGVFDGNGYVISNLTIDTAGAGNDYLGLFGLIGASSSEIINLGLENVNVTGGDGSWSLGGLCGFNSRGAIIYCYSSGSVTGGNGSYVIGGLCGFNYYGTITNCYTTGSVNGNQNFGGLCGKNDYGTITNCFSSSTVTGRSHLGGLCGENQGIITNCYAVGAVTSGVNPGYHLGGLSGENYGTISNCYATGAVTGGDNSDHLGGLCGENYNNGIITNCYATGTVAGGDNSEYLGGLCAYNYGTITNCYAVGAVTGGADSWSLGGLCGRNSRTITNCYFLDPADGGGPDNGQGTPLTDAQMKQQANFTNWDFADETAKGTSQIWQMPTESGYPVLSSFNGYIPVALSGDGTEASPYLINDANELGAIFHYSHNASFRLQADIDLTGINWSTAVVPAFGGCFDGNGHVIHNLNIEGGGCLGLFGRINGSSAEVKNLGLENGNITGADNSYYLGGLCGVNSEGTITNCYLTGSVTSGGDSRHLGGLCGQNLGTITNCYSAGSVNGWDDLGGLCGGNYGTISNCYSTGSVTGADNSENLGGLCGWNSDGAISNCFWDTQTSGMAIGYNLDSSYPGTITNVAGKTTTQMQTQSTFTGWNFDKPIWMISRQDYPRLIWNEPDIDDSGRVDIADFAIIAQHWQEIDCGFCNYSDLTGDRNTNVYDLIVLANSWLYGARISDHVAAVELYTGYNYGRPDNASDTEYMFELLVFTGRKVEKIEFLTPSGSLFEIPKEPYNETILLAGYIVTEWGYDEQASMDTGEDRYEWFYETHFDNSDSLDDYGDGWYTFTVYFGSGRTQQTDVFFGDSTTGQPLPQPTQEPVPLVPAHGENVTSQVTFQWQPCTDPNASFIHIYAEHETLDEEVEPDELLEKEVTSWGPVDLSEGPWVGGIFFGALDFTINADGIDVIGIKHSNVEFEFTVVP